ncbi:tetratricopeptide repeat protein [Flavobacteriaceae bacterium S0825]|uniref:tetratricopeptide repeat protein n=1 Tax=Gaetbulibacter sp. S0825 TaxID=2720084 RepID=UPI001431FAE2|nr:tetratricopeptide repeat protein [Gaetbulibacter sp. S0825]MCK0109842.1 tetratricopeptide repeat protein [Flavobacteriaceae bacterium S0825]NIX65471.1 tetratricopeptide repeat protein [Gaetbulibacter sp. S0825]
MKKQVILALALIIGSFSFAQKKELKTAEKAIKSSNFADAKAAIHAAESLMSAMDDKTKAKFYFLKGQALYANGTGSNEDIDGALESFKMLSDVEKTGKKVYTPQANNLKEQMGIALVQKGTTAYGNKNFELAASDFEKAYRISPTDTIFLYNAATAAVNGKDYDAALRIYKELSNIGYTGVSKQYLATEVSTGEDQAFPNEVTMNLSVKGKTHTNPRVVDSESKIGEIAKNITLIYISQGKNEEAIRAIEDAKKLNPNDVNLILAEADLYRQMDNTEKYTELISKALDLDPNNVALVFNLGVTAADNNDFDEAKKYYDKAIKMDPTYSNAYMNMAVLILDQEKGIIDEMNKLGTSAADNKKYDELKVKREKVYRDATPYLSKVLELNPKDINAATTLMNLYSALDDTENFKAMKAKVEALKNGN